ncbi:MAG: DUF1573 domain-containing protein [Planctomycetes bacterium]|nr:DUF1573 domain-containing protein [Planctomycetota bacterium]
MMRKRNIFLMLSVALFFFSSLCFYLYANSRESRYVNHDSTINTSSKTDLISANLSRDVGKVLSGEIIIEKVPIKNVSNRKLQLRIASTSCGCAEAILETENLNPGEETYISVHLNTSRKWKKGRFEAMVSFEITDVSSNNIPKASVIKKLEVLGQIDPNEGIFPTTIIVGKVRPGHGIITNEFQIMLNSSFDLNKKAIHWENHQEHLDNNFVRLSGSKKNNIWGGDIVIDSNKLPPREKIGEIIDTEIKFPIKYKGKKHWLALNIIGGIGSFVESSPNMIFWNKNNYSKNITLSLDAVGKAKMTVTNISCEEKGCLSYKIIDNGTSYPKIMVAQKSDTNKGDILRTKLRIEVSCGQTGSYVVVVPVMII